MTSKKLQIFFSSLIDVYLSNLIFLFSYTLSLYFLVFTLEMYSLMGAKGDQKVIY